MLVDAGADFKELVKEFSDKEVRFTTKRMIEAIRRASSQTDYHFPFPKRIVIWKVEVEEVIDLGPTAELRRKNPG